MIGKYRVLIMQLCAIMYGAVLFAAGAQEVADDSLKILSDRIDEIKNMRGVDIGLNAVSHFISNKIDISNPDSIYDRESQAFASADLTIEARPVQGISAKAILRLRTDWTSFFSHPIDEVNTRWVSVSGATGGFLTFDLGDYRSLYTPLSLGVPLPSLIGEPSILRKRRNSEMSDYFITDGIRPMQGLRGDLTRENLPLGLAAKVDLQASRIRSVDGIDSKIFDRTMFDRILAAARPQLYKTERFSAGFQSVNIFDITSTSFNAAQFSTTNTVQGVFGNLELGMLEIFGEGNWSSWKKSWEGGESPLSDLDEELSDNALFGGVKLKLPWRKISLTASYLGVGSDYRALAAQSPGVNWAITDRYLINTVHSRNDHFATGLYYQHFGRFATRYNTAVTDIFGRREIAANQRFEDNLPMSIYSGVDLNQFFTNKTFDPVQPLGDATMDRQGVVVKHSAAPFSFFSYEGEAALFKSQNDITYMRGELGINLSTTLSVGSHSLPYELTLGAGYTGIDGLGIEQRYTSSIPVENIVAEKVLLINNEKIGNYMLSAGVEAGVWENISLYGGVQNLISELNYDKIYYVHNFAADPKNRRNYRERADGLILNQFHYYGGVQFSVSEKSKILIGGRRQSFTPGNPENFSKTLVSAVTEGEVVSYQPVTGQTTINLELKKYSIDLFELLFFYDF